MSTQIRKPDRYFNPFYQDNFILIQLILQEFLKSYQLSLKIDKLFKKLSESPSILDGPSMLFYEMLGNLVGYLPFQENSSHPPRIKGPLTKFKDYCEQFSRNSSNLDHLHVNLHMLVHQAWLFGAQTLELLNLLHSNYRVLDCRTTVFIDSSKRIMQNFQSHFNQICHTLPEAVNRFCNNENVLLCLLRNKKSLTEVYGRHYLNKQFKCPMSEQELIPFLLGHYQARGFETSISAILETVQKS